MTLPFTPRRRFRTLNPMTATSPATDELLVRIASIYHSASRVPACALALTARCAALDALMWAYLAGRGGELEELEELDEAARRSDGLRDLLTRAPDLSPHPHLLVELRTLWVEVNAWRGASVRRGDAVAARRWTVCMASLERAAVALSLGLRIRAAPPSDAR